MGCKMGVHPSVLTGPAGVVEVPYLEGPLLPAVTPRWGRCVANVQTDRSCSTHLPVPCWLHPFLWVLHTIHYDQLTTNMPSASTTGDTVPWDFFNISWSNRYDAKPGLTPRNQPSVDSLEFLLLNLIITVSPFKYLNCLPSPASSGSRGPIPGHFEASQSLGEALTNPSLNTPVLVRTEFGLPNPELIYFNTITI
ncbi:hypothetical protein GOODEAATRI_027028 [Goodea atripinnis]|uniref:Uncharacterized protein n=1 Tax=Goodea atripinnis TaxID=208336 RepID=A0ABV0NDW8_9TELE